MRRPETARLLDGVRSVMASALDQGGTSFDSLYVNVNGESGYFDRSLAVYGRAGEPCPRCGTPIRRASVHESIVVLLPALSAATAAPALVSATTGSDSRPVRLTAWVRGRVQGVGFRWWVRSRALELGLAGSATNLDDGRVQVVAEGAAASDCEQLLAQAFGSRDAGPGTRRHRPLVGALGEGDWSGFSER